MPTTNEDYITAEDARVGFLPVSREARTFITRVEQVLTGLGVYTAPAMLAAAKQEDIPQGQKEAIALACKPLAELRQHWESHRDKMDDAFAYADSILPTILQDLPPAPEPAPHPDLEAP
jgi:hypothetical protein